MSVVQGKAAESVSLAIRLASHPSDAILALDSAVEAIDAAPLTDELRTAVCRRLANARRFLQSAEVGAAGYELCRVTHLLTSHVPQRDSFRAGLHCQLRHTGGVG